MKDTKCFSIVIGGLVLLSVVHLVSTTREKLKGHGVFLCVTERLFLGAS